MWFTILELLKRNTVKFLICYSAFYLHNTGVWISLLLLQFFFYQIIGLIYCNLTIIWNLNRMVYENYSIDSHCEFCSESFAPYVPIPLDHRRHLSEMFIQPWKSIPLLLSIFFFSKKKSIIYVIFVSFISDA